MCDGTSKSKSESKSASIWYEYMKDDDEKYKLMSCALTVLSLAV